jgi:hypothetical protein
MMDDRNHDDPERLDLTPLDPRADPARFERLVREVRRAATPELVRRQTGLTLWGQLTRWRRPILATSGLLALASAVVLLVVHPSATTQATQTTLAEGFGVPSQVARWVQGTEKPSPGDLLGAEGSRQ